MAKQYVFFDIESMSAGAQYGVTPEEFFKLGQYAINDGPVILTEDLEEMRSVLRAADFVVGHNIISFDLPAIIGMESIEPLQMAMSRKVIDTFYVANLLTPAPYSYTDAKGHTFYDAAKPEAAKKWLSLANLSFQFNLPGKLGDLSEIAKLYNPPKTPKTKLDYGLIDVKDESYRDYAIQDVIAVRALYKYLMDEIKGQDYPGEYIWRHLEVMSATAGQMVSNGILVNQEYANEKIARLAKQREETLDWLVKEYDFPTEGKAPWATAKGKEVILKVLADFGIRPDGNDDWPRTPTGAPKLGGEDLIAITEGSEAEEFARALAGLKGMRSIPQQVMDNMKPDGRVHPEITALQRSGRWSVTKPGVTVIGDRTEALKEDKALFIASPGKVLAGFDFSSADARAMASLSGDEEFAKRFQTDDEGNDLYDGHNLTGEAIFGSDVYYSKMDKKGKPFLRPVAKMAGHAQNYNIGAYKLANTLNLAARKDGLEISFWAPAGRGKKAITQHEDSLDTRDMISAFNEAYPWLKAFKDKSVREAEQYGYITSTWGRRLLVDKGSEYTTGPALYGQNATAEMMGTAILNLIRRGEYYIRALRCIIHDELLMELDEDRVEEDIKVIRQCMEGVFDPKTNVSMPIAFPVGVGYGKTWKDAAH